MANLVTTYQLIADILSFNSNPKALEAQLKDEKMNWDAMVTEGSKHLVLPTIYCRLNNKQLLNFLPKELETYLAEITSINRNRNEAIIRQAKELSQLLNAHHIDHVFLKGTALLVSGYYKDIAERMVGDIDILIAEHQINKAFDLVVENGYKPIASTLGTDFFDSKHLPRLTTTNNISALELHLKLFTTYKSEHLQPKDILEHKFSDGRLYLPCNRHLILHNIFNHQINDYGTYYNYLDFRSAYDTIVLIKQDETSNLKASKNKHIIKHFKLLGIFFSDLHQTMNISISNKNRFYLLKLKYRWINNVYVKSLKLLATFSMFMHRFYMFLFNSKYRTAILKDRKRVLALIKSKLLLKSKHNSLE
ncbi:nucleotidyltransferase family protein [Winogradskyella ursingii]|uniref:nucleotidyltransferase family protein n=1 Tax=Winogradskyella ursingii TaxID=2686079 RepID=UPI0015CE3859|nr:nucleotidyltransferase family protein [Winogradskyella ursingii]